MRSLPLLLLAACAAVPPTQPAPFTARIADIFQGQDVHGVDGRTPEIFLFISIEFAAVDPPVVIESMEYELSIDGRPGGRSQTTSEFKVQSRETLDFTIRGPQMPVDQAVRLFKEGRPVLLTGTARGKDSSGKPFQLQLKAQRQ